MGAVCRGCTKVCNRNLMVAHCRQLFDGSLPVFVAASINNSVHQLIFIFNYHGQNCKDNYNEKCDNLTTNVICLNLLYAILSHTFGYLYIIYLNGKFRYNSREPAHSSSSSSSFLSPEDRRSPFHIYCSKVSLENASFAWRQSLSLIVLYWLDSSGSGDVDKGIVLLQWVISLIAIISVVICLFYLRKYFIMKKVKRACCNLISGTAAKNSANEELMWFDSEAFSLALASSFTIILIVYIYPQKDSNYLTIMDDTGGAGLSSYDDGNDANKYSGREKDLSSLFVLYAIILTALLTLAQIYGNRYYYYHHYFVWFVKKLNVEQYFSKRSSSGDIRYNSVNSSGFQLVESDQFDTPLEEEFDIDDDDQDQNLNDQLAFDNKRSSIGGSILSMRNLAGGQNKGSGSVGKNSSTSANSLYKSICHLSLTTIAYLVVSAWYSWSVISFQSYFSFINQGTCLGLFVFAVVITLLMLTLLLLFTQVSATYRVNQVADEPDSDYINPIVTTKPIDYIIEPEDEDEEYTVDKDEEVQWLLITGRFLVGWAFANFISLSITKIMTSLVSNGSLAWLSTVEKVLLSIIVFTIGALVETNRTSEV